MPQKKIKEYQVVGIGGSVSPMVKAKIATHARNKGITTSRLVGMILTEWVEGIEDRFGIWKGLEMCKSQQMDASCILMEKHKGEHIAGNGLRWRDERSY